MIGLRFCRICLDDNVRMHQILGSEVQDVYEKLKNKKVQEEGRLHFACYICYCQLKKCQQLVLKSQKSAELLRQTLLIDSKMHLKSISFSDRLTYGLVNSLMVVRLDYLKTPDYKNILKIEIKCESDSNEVMVKDEPHDDSEFQYELRLEEEHNFDQDKAGAVGNSKRNTFETETKLVANENKSSQIGCGEIYPNQLLIKDEKNTLICNDCGETYCSKALLTKHINGHKPVNRKPNKKLLKVQKSICHRRGAESEKLKKVFDTYMDEKLLNCQFCAFTSKKKSNLQLHIRTHTGEKPFKCQYCSYTCSQNITLQAHIRTHTGEKPFKCQYCSYTSSQNITLKAHVRTHTGEKPFKCQYCSYTCSQNSTLKAHVRTHTGEKPFKCQDCSYTCSQNSTLKAHVRTHTGEKPFKCQFCSYTCSNKSTLKTHVRTHTGEKPFKCQLCSYTSSQNSTLKVHVRTHTGEKPFKCQYCSYTCSNNNTLKAHFRTHTGEKPF